MLLNTHPKQNQGAFLVHNKFTHLPQYCLSQKWIFQLEAQHVPRAVHLFKKSVIPSTDTLETF